MKPIPIVIVLFLTVNTVLAIGPYCTGDTLNCLALNGLKLRDAPKGNRLEMIPLGGKVVVLSKGDASYDTIERITGYWIQVKFNKTTGYVFDGFLSKMPAPGLQDSSLYEYLERVAVRIGKPVSQTNECIQGDVGEGTYHVDIQLYQGDHFTARQISYVGWEWGHVTTGFDYASFEEIFLICKVIFHQTMKASEMPALSEEKILMVNSEDDSGYNNITIKLVGELDPQVLVTAEFGY